ncbi:MAG: 4-hydroxythreonine-4-phosphate dehydrogenase PdxA [Candidatus Omnitrophica bacterium]|nr:4-hydroxythreonine-4-phosphate dehydrogenase PdxA [Candidatus Omnitrophota bacterium]
MPTSPSGNAPVICITTGDPRGIGPEIIKKALRHRAIRGKAHFLVIGESGAKGRGERASAQSAVESIKTAFGMVMAGSAGAIVTGPVSKQSINRAGIRFEGHTEFLAALSGTGKFTMMFVSEALKVSLVTRHIPLGKVRLSISAGSVYNAAELTYAALKDWFAVKAPRIGISGLNPHCGEGGILGDEERRFIRPAVSRLKRKFDGIYGPISADALFYDLYHNRYDAALAMYHDQALAAFKMIARDRGVNLTLGLPFIRTSPDHGPAFDIAGKGIADPGSMIEAIKLATRLCSQLQRSKS